MDARERYGDYEELLRAAIGALQASLWTCLPGYIVAFDAATVTATVQIGISGQVTDSSGNRTAVNFPVLTDVPVIFPRGGGCTLTFPINPGDECIVHFASRAIDGWAQSGGVQPPSDARKHSLSDAFVMVGAQSQAHKIGGISTSKTQLRSDDGTAYVELDPAGHIVNVVAPGGINLTGPLNVNGNTTFTGQVSANGKRIDQTHTHNGVQTGSGNSGAVN